MKTFLLFGATALLLTSFSLPVQADKAYSEKDLDGVYVYNLVEIRHDESDPTIIDYCDQYGTVTFNGDGTGSNTGTRKCSATGNFYDETSAFTYTVTAEGVVEITEVNQPYPTRVQLVDKGRMGLIDSTTREEPHIFVQHGVAVEQ
jgi:hypothetical protein